MPTYRGPLNGLSMSEALAEDAQSAGVTRVKLSTLELWHPSMTEPVRVVIDPTPLLATLEDDAPRNAGEEVSFTPCYVEFPPREETEANGPMEVDFTISNVNQLVSEALTLARESDDPAVRDALWQVIERVYMSDDTDAPHVLPVFKITLARVTLAGGTAVFTGAYRPSSVTSIPAITFTPQYYSGLLS